MGRQKDRLAPRQIERQTDRQIVRPVDGLTKIQTDRHWNDRQMDVCETYGRISRQMSDI
jgi:hypothetical protein